MSNKAELAIVTSSEMDELLSAIAEYDADNAPREHRTAENYGDVEYVDNLRLEDGAVLGSAWDNENRSYVVRFVTLAR